MKLFLTWVWCYITTLYDKLKKLVGKESTKKEVVSKEIGDIVNNAANTFTEKWKETLPKQSTRLKNRIKRKRSHKK